MGSTVVFAIPKTSVKFGYCMVICAALFAALLHVVGKPLLGQNGQDFDIHPIILAAIIFIINGIFFSGLSKKSTPIKSIGRKNIILMIIIGITEVSALMVFFFGLKESNAVNASIFSNSEILFSMVIALIVFREKLRLTEIGPFSMILCGMTALPIGFDLYQNGMHLSDLVLGDLLILSSGLLYAIDINICKYVSDRFDAKRITQITSFSAGIFALLLSFLFQIPFEVNIEQIPPIALIGIIGTGLSTLFFFVGLRLLGAMRTILLYSTTSIFGVIFSIILLGEGATLIDFAAIGITLLGIFLLRNRLAEEHEDSDKINDKGNEKSFTKNPEIVQRKYHKFSSKVNLLINQTLCKNYDPG